MKDSFFINKRHHFDSNVERASKKKLRPSAQPAAEETAGDGEKYADIEDMDLRHFTGQDQDEKTRHLEDEESAQEKRIRLAKKYIKSLEDDQNLPIGFDAADVDRELIQSRLRQDHREAAGTIFRKLADKFPIDDVTMKLCRGHSSAVCCVAVSNELAFSGGKDGRICKFDLATGRLLFTFYPVKKGAKDKEGHAGLITALAISSDGKFLASGGSDKKICLWSTDTSNALLKIFPQHRDTVTGLAFRLHDTSNYALYSSSRDRTVKVFNIAEMAYVETLFGHQDSITSLSHMGARERCLSAGGRDRTVRVWKIVEESQLVFRSSSGRRPRSLPSTIGALEASMVTDETGSVDCVTFLDNDTWISGSDGGTLAVWNSQRKKPVQLIPNAHGRVVQVINGSLANEPLGSDEVVEVPNANSYGTNIFSQSIQRLMTRENYSQVVEELSQFETTSSPNWITSLCAYPHSDLIFSGSCDGLIRVWKFGRPSVKSIDNDDEGVDADGEDEEDKRKKLTQISSIPLRGFINSLQITADGQYLVAAVGKEPRDGRWSQIKQARNAVAIIKLSLDLKQ